MYSGFRLPEAPFVDPSVVTPAPAICPIIFFDTPTCVRGINSNEYVFFLALYSCLSMKSRMEYTHLSIISGVTLK
ncbi:unnamed protein product [Acanthoscelides obtectus]|uniref:Uncharacterized protein n=1 Tax=Acanthoscelides obtectus TaxID=200917 RepID=A0A9P0NRM7_ACAOB|nr:unnamed protein product [Acanthoscelides obtectus]CAK1665713.1 hypothetical protein AOBTE_LOCUS24930 [Acanthoscelides obtectus]